METKPNYKVSWTTIYTLGLVPLIIVWGLDPSTDERIIVSASIVVGIIWAKLSRYLIQYPQGCGIIGWATGWSLVVGGVCKALLLLLGITHLPIVLFLAPALTLLLYNFRQRNVQPLFCHQCIVCRGGLQERRLLGDFSRYEAQHITYLILMGGALVSLLSWALFIYGIKWASRAGIYYYSYFPLGLIFAVILFEIIRRFLIQTIFDSHEKKSKKWVQEDKKEMPCYTSIRVVVLCQGEIFLIKIEDKSSEPIEGDSGWDTPIHQYRNYCSSLDEEKQLARKTIRELLHIENPDLRHLSSTTAPSYLRRVGQYLLFLPAEERERLNRYPGSWHSTEEVNKLYHENQLYPLFKELYARLYTVVNTANTYYNNGKRRLAIKKYTPTFSLQHLEKSDIEFDNPIWLYVSQHNEDKWLYRLSQKLDNLFHKQSPHA